MTKENCLERLERLERKLFREPLRFKEWNARWFLSHGVNDPSTSIQRSYAEYTEYLDWWDNA